MKLFSLDNALSGKPVELRNGSKAYVVGLVPDVVRTAYPLRGVVVERNEFGDLIIDVNSSWTIEGRANLNVDEHPLDIVGMAVEPIKYRHINGHKFPEPCSEPLEDGQSYFTIDFDVGAEVVHHRWSDDAYDNARLERGLIHTTQEAAQAHADAINSLFRGEPCPD